MTPIPERLLEDARLYAARGWSAIPVCGKRSAIKWAPFCDRVPSAEELQDWFARPAVTGVAVIAGKVSSGLTVRDFDQQGAYERFCSENPDLASLPVAKTHRGCHMYCRSNLEKIVHLGDGEFRGAGYSIAPHSRHSTGEIYEWMKPLPSGPLPFVEAIRFGVDATSSDTDSQQVCVSVSLRLCVSVSDAVNRTLPTKQGERNRRLWDFARALKSVPGMASATPAQLRDALRQWYERAKPFIATKDFATSWIEFEYAWPRVKRPLGSGLLDELMAKADASNPPAIAQQYESFTLRRLVCLCREMQRAIGDKPFFLSCRDAGALLGVQCDTASVLLSKLVRDGLLVLVERGTRLKASLYRWIADDGSKTQQEQKL